MHVRQVLKWFCSRFSNYCIFASCPKPHACSSEDSTEDMSLITFSLLLNSNEDKSLSFIPLSLHL